VDRHERPDGQDLACLRRGPRVLLLVLRFDGAFPQCVLSLFFLVICYRPVASLHGFAFILFAHALMCSCFAVCFWTHKCAGAWRVDPRDVVAGQRAGHAAGIGRAFLQGDLCMFVFKKRLSTNKRVPEPDVRITAHTMQILRNE
jgi:hypothetical protein